MRQGSGTTELRSYTYTDNGLLSTANYNSRSIENFWDASGNRVRFVATSGTHTFVYDITAGNPSVIDEDGVYYIREPDGSLIARTSGTDIRYYHFDALGSTRLLTDSDGDVTDKYSYDAYGCLISHDEFTGSIDQPYQFVGKLGYYTHWMEPEFGLLQLGVRFYDTETGRFTQKDPIQDGMNFYVYAEANPILSVDPSGLQCDFGALCIADRIGDALACVDKWSNWWKKNHPWSKKNPPKYGRNMDKVGHCFVTCKAIKDCGMSKTGALSIGRVKECGDFFGKTGSDADDMKANRLGAKIAGQSNSNCLPDCLKAVQKEYGGIPVKYLGHWNPRWEPR